MGLSPDRWYLPYKVTHRAPNKLIVSLTWHRVEIPEAPEDQKLRRNETFVWRTRSIGCHALKRLIPSLSCAPIAHFLDDKGACWSWIDPVGKISPRCACTALSGGYLNWLSRPYPRALSPWYLSGETFIQCTCTCPWTLQWSGCLTNAPDLFLVMQHAGP